MSQNGVQVNPSPPPNPFESAPAQGIERQEKEYGFDT